MIYAILISLPVLNLLWYGWAMWRLRNAPGRRVWRWGISVFFAFMVFGFMWQLLNRRGGLAINPPAIVLSYAYVWQLLILPVTTALILFGETLRGLWLGIARLVRWQRVAAAPATEQPGDEALSRRQFLTIAAVATPPALTIISGTFGYLQTQMFTVTPMQVDVPGLPPALDGTVIAHLSDFHCGRFTNEKVLRRIVDETLDLRADMIVMTGDLIDYALADLPNALSAIRRLDAPNGVYLCEGNHDLFESRTEFEKQVRAAGLNILINETADVKIAGYPVQLHGLRWGTGGDAHGHRRDGAAAANLPALEPNRNPEAFPILLAHHPHAFDPAAEANYPLVLSGHTHGGQLMVTPGVGAGPLMFKYWSGLYRKPASRLVVNNGAGNWLPLRINSPAEIGLLTLRRA